MPCLSLLSQPASRKAFPYVLLSTMIVYRLSMRDYLHPRSPSPRRAIFGRMIAPPARLLRRPPASADRADDAGRRRCQRHSRAATGAPDIGRILAFGLPRRAGGMAAMAQIIKAQISSRARGTARERRRRAAARPAFDDTAGRYRRAATPKRLRARFLAMSY